MDNNGVKEIRKSIQKRKKMRNLGNQEVESKQIPQSLPLDEEKHGYYPAFGEMETSGKERNTLGSRFAIKLFISALIFFVAAFLSQTDADLFNQPKQWAGSMLNEEFPFAQVNVWYRDVFGTPLSYGPDQDQTETAGTEEALAFPVQGNITESFQNNGEGVMISPGAASEVSSMREGVVIFAGNDSETDKTVTIQHADGSETSYGFLSNIDVHLYQYVTNNQQIGDFTPTEEDTSVYFSIEKNDNYLDPARVIPVDQLS